MAPVKLSVTVVSPGSTVLTQVSMAAKRPLKALAISLLLQALAKHGRSDVFGEGREDDSRCLEAVVGSCWSISLASRRSGSIRNTKASNTSAAEAQISRAFIASPDLKVKPANLHSSRANSMSPSWKPSRSIATAALQAIAASCQAERATASRARVSNISALRFHWKSSSTEIAEHAQQRHSKPYWDCRVLRRSDRGIEVAIGP